MACAQVLLRHAGACEIKVHFNQGLVETGLSALERWLLGSGRSLANFERQLRAPSRSIRVSSVVPENCRSFSGSGRATLELSGRSTTDR